MRCGTIAALIVVCLTECMTPSTAQAQVVTHSRQPYRGYRTAYSRTPAVRSFYEKAPIVLPSANESRWRPARDNEVRSRLAPTRVHQPVYRTSEREALRIDGADERPRLDGPLTGPPARETVREFPINDRGGCACPPTPRTVTSYPERSVTSYPERSVTSYPPARPPVYRPLIPLGSLPPRYFIGQGILGQPKIYVPRQPVRNFLRYLSP